jgi:predicted unusual protein kinase regulating ubiquinone biosynthesis (AarF/ABC1/UbiB family)
MSDDDHVQTGRLRRLSRIAYLTARTTGDLFAAQARRRIGGGGDAAAANDQPDLTRAAERILETLGELKGAALKLGQALAMDPDALPPEARRIVAKLLSQAPQRMPYETVAQVIAAELGAPPEALFASFEKEPIAAASLGQVHAATLPAALGGGEVVVKVQYPGVDKALESDLANAGVLVKGIALTGETLDGRAYYDEVRNSLMRELDYREEAAQCTLYAQASVRYPELVVPLVIPERSGRRVLCMTRLRGPNLMEAIEANPTPEERFRIARLMIFAIWGPFFAARLIHADPHPGNFLVLPDGRLGVLDFGATKLLSEGFAQVYRGFLGHHANGKRRPQVGPALQRAGFRFLGDDEDDAFDFCERIADIVERPILKDEEYDFGEDPMVLDTRRVFRSEPRLALSIKPPVEAILFYRSAAGLAQDLRLLKAKGRFRPVLKEIEERGAHRGAAAASAQGP